MASLTPDALADAIAASRFDQVLAAVDGGLGKDSCVCGRPLILEAAAAGGKALVEGLLDRGADVATKTPDGWTAVMWAAQDGHESTVELLLDRGADLEAREEVAGPRVVRGGAVCGSV
ncbi:hypothetical protein FNF27_08078 [Cafeteria roenbergensis]|uniref:Uncharacterized protein n=1 Tax=Cafeteria roenbergensis TaxID=33653 RepID=A0A5A8DAH9_CAFRO|nr:hypothetical protein FNF27_08078 [Cafeteria roenbergensis]